MFSIKTKKERERNLVDNGCCISATKRIRAFMTNFAHKLNVSVLLATAGNSGTHCGFCSSCLQTKACHVTCDA